MTLYSHTDSSKTADSIVLYFLYEFYNLWSNQEASLRSSDYSKVLKIYV